MADHATATPTIDFMNETPKEKNPAAVALGRLNAGKPRVISEEERTRRSERMKALRAKMLLDPMRVIHQTHTEANENKT
jgi:hypothetical protein